MLMTEEEARTKWCPMARVAIQNVASNMAVLTGSSPIHPVGNRATLIAGRERHCDTATGSRCIGSECMAWRLSIEDCTPPGSNGIGEPVEAHAVGFCGAFGKPEA